MYIITYREKDGKTEIVLDGETIARFPTISEAIFHAQVIGLSASDLKDLNFQTFNEEEAEPIGSGIRKGQKGPLGK